MNDKNDVLIWVNKNVPRKFKMCSVLKNVTTVRSAIPTRQSKSSQEMFDWFLSLNYMHFLTLQGFWMNWTKGATLSTNDSLDAFW